MRVVALLLVIGWTHCGEDDFRGTSTLWLLSRAESREGVARMRPSAARIADRSGVSFTLWSVVDDAGVDCGGRVEVVANGLTAHLTFDETPAFSFGDWHRVCEEEGCTLPFTVTNQTPCTINLSITASVVDQNEARPVCDGEFRDGELSLGDVIIEG